MQNCGGASGGILFEDRGWRTPSWRDGRFGWGDAGFSNLLFKTDRAGLADFTRISAIYVCHLWPLRGRQIGGYYTGFWGGSKGKRAKNAAGRVERRPEVGRG